MLAWLAAGAVSLLPDALLEGRAPDLDARADEVSEALDRLRDEAVGIAAEALGSFPPRLAPSPARQALLDRLEGIAIIDADGGFLIWQGSPADPPGGFLDAGGPAAWIEKHGAVSRWIVRAGPDEEGWLSLASFTLRSEPGDAGLAALLPEPLRSGVEITVTPGAVGAPAEDTVVRRWSADENAAPLRIVLQRDLTGPRAERQRRTAVAIAALVTLIVLAFVPRWRTRVTTNAGFLQALAAVAGARLLLGFSDAPQWLLAREAASASLFGVRTFGRLLASPADLLLTCIALYLLALALRARLGAAGAPLASRARWTLIASTGAAAVLTGRLIVVVSRNSRDSLLDTAGEWASDARLLVAAGLALALLAVATLASCSLLRSALRKPSALEALVPTVLAFSVLAIATALVLQHRQEAAALERLRVDLAPQVLEQGARRKLALEATVAQVSRAYADPTPDALDLAPEDLAFHYWIDSALAHGGYQSSLDFYDINLELVSHFGYDVPELDELVGPLDSLPTEVTDEPFQPVPTVRQRLLHVEAPLYREGELRGMIVAHVLDEPDNLPFLPAGRAYLAALGQERAAAAAELHYVVYDAQGTPLRSTLARPPAERGEFRLAALEGRTVSFDADDERFVGVALGERDRLHLLLVERPELLERLAGALRFLLFGLIVVVLVKFVPQLLEPGGPARLRQALRGSFQRKLVAATLVASVVPLIGLSLILRSYIQNRADEELASTAVGFARAAQNLIEDVITPLEPDLAGDEAGAAIEVSDSFLLWLRRVVGQDVHVFERGSLVASSKRELFDAGVLSERLDGWVQRQITLEGRPSLVQRQTLGGFELPVAYAPVRNADAARQMVVAVPMAREPGEIQREVRRVAEIILVTTVLLAALLIVAATYLARTVARPVRALAGATAQIAAGNYGTQLAAQTHDEIADLVRGFNAMARSLKQQRTALERRREYIEALLQHATTGILSVDPQGTIVTLNPTAAALLSAAGANAGIGSDLEAALEPAAALGGMRAALRDRARGEAEPVEFDLEHGRETRRLRMVRVPLPAAEGGSVGTLILIDDVTELMRSNQLSAWAEMARAIAHEIKNPLTPIQLSAEHLRRLLEDRGIFPDEKVEACIETVIKQVRTLYEIAGEFSSYAKLPVLAPEPHDPVEFMREMLSPYRSSSVEGIELVERYEPSPAVAIDYRVLTRAVVNLIQNAIQAMPDGGRLHVNVRPDGTARVEISVRDTGIGLDPEVRRRLFEPYFSTKSSGTGLGLAITSRAVEAHGGTIEVDSPASGGTRFRILLPVA